jgi:hypothetical protein
MRAMALAAFTLGYRRMKKRSLELLGFMAGKAESITRFF